MVPYILELGELKFSKGPKTAYSSLLRHYYIAKSLSLNLYKQSYSSNYYLSLSISKEFGSLIFYITFFSAIFGLWVN